MVVDAMEIEEVAAHNADAYNPGRGSAQKRKREKAQEQLRHRMRRRNNGTSSSMVSSRLKNSSHNTIGQTTLQGVKTVWHTVKNNSKDEWQTQEARYTALAHPDGVMGGDKKARHEVVPLGELVDRVIQRRGHMTDSSPMTIRAIKPPAPPFAIQQPSLIRKMVHVQQPINKRKPKSSGPYVVVLKRDTSTKNSGPTRNNETKVLPPLKPQNNLEDVEMGTWRPELEMRHKPYIHPNAEDRSVTNYRLQMQQAVKIAELRCDFSISAKPMHKHAPLPAIQVSYEVDEEHPLESPAKVELEVNIANAEEEPIKQEEKQADNQESLVNVTKDSSINPDRYTSSKEVLTLMQARKQAKRRKIKGDDFKNPLRTRNRYTVKSKQFKEDISKVRELSIIQEDQSSISDRLSRLSAGKTSVASFRSVASLKRIEETEVPGYHKTGPQSSRSRDLNKTPTGEHENDTQSSVDDHNMPSEDENDICDPESDLNRTEVSYDHQSSNSNIHAANLHNDTKSEVEPGETNTTITDTDKLLTTSNDIDINSSVVVQTYSEIDQNIVWIPGEDSPSPDSFLDSETKTCIDNPPIFSQDNSSEYHDSDRTTGESQEDESNLTSEKPDQSEDESVVVMETKKQKSVDRFREADSHQGVPTLETFDRRDIILPAETVQ